ncbi:MAG TPA: DUF4838 domain-containing protein [Usitatibacter sp.]|jgi:hypothetical protein|nr:DUF4838 domain-containing protein [Usitatibacter sp.]
MVSKLLPSLTRATAAALAALAGILPAWPFTLVRDGEPRAVIVVSKEAYAAQPWRPVPGPAPAASAKVRLAAEELQRYVARMSGATLPIVPDGAPGAAGTSRILVGAGNAVAALGVDVPRGLTMERREEGYLIDARSDVLVLAGNDEGPYQGTFFAVADFLERAGVRWFMPGAFGEIVPRSPTICIGSLHVLEKPAFILRAWDGNLAPELRDDEAMWRLRNRLTLDADAILALPTDASLRNYLPTPDQAVLHPEWFARRADGSTDPYLPNLASPEAAAIVAEKVKARVRAERATHPDFNSLGISPDDGLPVDLRAQSAAASLGFASLLGRESVPQERSISEEWFTFVNRVAEDVTREFPGFILTTNGYANRSVPPEGVTLHPGLGIMFAAIWADLLHAYDDPRSWQQEVHATLLRRWAALNSRVFEYRYDHPMLVNALTPLPATRRIVRDTRLALRWGVAGFHDEQSFSWMANGILAYYMRARMYWDPDADADKIADDFYAHWYGPAAPHARAFWDALEDAIEGTRLLGHEDRVLPYVYTPRLLERLEAAQRAAEAAATAEPFATRVRVDRLVLEHLKGYYAMSWAELGGDFAAAARAADSMFAQREGLHAVSAFFHVPETKEAPQRYYSDSFYWNLSDRRESDRRLAAQLDGTTGELVAMAPRNAAFTVDPLDIGRYEQWYLPASDRSRWREVDTAIPFYLQDPAWMSKAGAPYVGYAWYAFEIELARPLRAGPLKVLVPTVSCEAWAWVNGRFAAHRPYQAAYVRPASFEFDAGTELHAGRNVIAIRVDTSSSRVQAAEGILGPLLVWSPR